MVKLVSDRKVFRSTRTSLKEELPNLANDKKKLIILIETAMRLKKNLYYPPSRYTSFYVQLFIKINSKIDFFVLIILISSPTQLFFNC